MTISSNLDGLKQAAARKAVEYIEDGMVVGLGTGSTAIHFIRALGDRIRRGLRLRGVPTSQDTADLARHCGIDLIGSEDRWDIDVAVDGADQVDAAFNLIKGGGGALLKEKIVAASAKQFIVLVDHTKQVPVLGGTFPLPVEVIPFGWGNTARKIDRLTQGVAALRERRGRPFRTEAGHLILDVRIDQIDRPHELQTALNEIPGVVETGIFVGRTDILLVGKPDGVEVRRVNPRTESSEASVG